MRTSASEEYTFPSCPQNVRTGKLPSPPDYGRLLWTTANGNRAWVKNMP